MPIATGVRGRAIRLIELKRHRARLYELALGELMVGQGSPSYCYFRWRRLKRVSKVVMW